MSLRPVPRSILRSIWLVFLVGLDQEQTAAAASDISAHTSTSSTLHCRLALHNRLHENHDKSSSPATGPLHFVSCQPLVNGLVTPYSYSLPHDDILLQEAQQRLQTGETVYMTIPKATVEQSRVLSLAQASLHAESPVPLHHRQLQSLPQPIGSLSALVIRVIATDAAPEPTRDELSSYIFDSAVSMRSQMLACSAGKLSIGPTQLRVLDVNVAMSSQGRNYIDLVNAAYDASVLQLQGMSQYSWATDLREMADLLLFVVPDKTVSFDGSNTAQWDWAAYGTIPGQVCVLCGCIRAKG